MTRLPGRPASTVPDGLGARDVEDIWGQIGAVARAFHTVTFEEFAYLGPQGVLEPVGRRNGRWLVTGVVDMENALPADPMLVTTTTGDETLAAGLEEVPTAWPPHWPSRRAP